LISLIAITLFVDSSQAQAILANVQNILHENAVFDKAELTQLQQGEPVVTVLPAHHKQEVAVYGLVRVQAHTDAFLESFRDTMVKRSNPGILEIGRFGSKPALDDLNSLTMEDRDVEDLKKCVVGNCDLKLSAEMIDQFKNSVDWESSNYRTQATDVYKRMLVEYVRDYLERGDDALIEYSDKSKTFSVRDGQRALLASLPRFVHQSFSGQGFQTVENALVWSKIKFGLKPVLAINHIVILKNENQVGPQVLVISKQIYANHYFDGSIGVTGLATNLPGAEGSYLFYENHSLADGLQGLFGNIKRNVIEREAVDGLKNVLRGTRARLDIRAASESDNGPADKAPYSWKRLRFSNKQFALLLFCVTALSMIALASYYRKANIPPGKHAN